MKPFAARLPAGGWNRASNGAFGPFVARRRMILRCIARPGAALGRVWALKAQTVEHRLVIDPLVVLVHENVAPVNEGLLDAGTDSLRIAVASPDRADQHGKGDPIRFGAAKPSR